jgi:sugar phosphate isomerase/epimerase
LVKAGLHNNLPKQLKELRELACHSLTFYNELGIKRFKKIVDYAQKLGIKVAFENTRIEGYLDYVITNITNDNVGICYDAGHCHTHFKDRFNYDLFKNRIFAVHLHDNDQSGDQHLLPFDGTIDWNHIIKTLKDNGYQGPVTLELIYDDKYFNFTPEQFYKKGYDIGKKISQMFDEL